MISYIIIRILDILDSPPQLPVISKIYYKNFIQMYSDKADKVLQRDVKLLEEVEMFEKEIRP